MNIQEIQALAGGVEERLREQRASLQATLDQERSRCDELVEQVRQSQSVQRRVSRAIDALLAVERERKPVSALKRKRDSNAWRIGDKRYNAMWEWVRTHFADGEPFTKTQLVNGFGGSNSTGSKSLNRMREEGRIRIVASNAHGRITYALMPEYIDDEAKVARELVNGAA
jgi:hypothetical protein